MRLADFIDAAATELGMQRSEVNTRLRHVREAGYLRSGPRGRGALHMNADDLAAALLALIDAVEPTASGRGLREMVRMEFDFCQWINLSTLDRLPRPGEQPLKGRWAGAPLSPAMGTALVPSDPWACLAGLLTAVVQDPALIAIEGIGRESCMDGVTLTFDHREHASAATMKARYVAHTWDESDGWFFGDSTKPGQWRIITSFRVSEPQADRRRHLLELPGKLIARLARAVLEVTP